jgi:hypothetical protein
MKDQTLEEYRNTKIIDDARGLIPSASSSDRWVNCPASHYANIWKESEASEAAQMGTRIHNAMSLFDSSSLTNEEEIELYNKAQDQLNTLIDQNTVNEGYLTVFKEERIGNTYFTGKPDLVLSMNRRIFIIDYKFGRKEKDASDALQMQSLASLMLDDDDNWLTENHEGFTFVIIQPLVSGKPSTAEASFREIFKSSMEINFAAVNASQGDQTRKAGEWCEYCEVRSICDKAFQLSISTESDCPAMTIDGKWERIKVAESLLKKFKADTEAKMIKGIEDGTISGYELKPGRKTREITDMKQAWKVLSNEGVTQDAFIASCKLTKTTLIDLFAEDQEIPKTQAKKRIEAAIFEVSEEKQSEKPTISKITR